MGAATRSLERIIRHRGTAVTVRRITAVFDPVAGEPTETTADYVTRAEIVDDVEMLTEGVIERGERALRFVATRLDITPSPLTPVDPDDSTAGEYRDVVILNDIQHEVIRTEPRHDRDRVIGWLVTVRR